MGARRHAKTLLGGCEAVAFALVFIATFVVCHLAGVVSSADLGSDGYAVSDGEVEAPRPFAVGRALKHLELDTTCEPGTSVTHEQGEGVCVDCPDGHYTSGRKPVCKLLDLTDFDCSSYFNPTTFQTKYGFSDVVGVECDFGSAKPTYTLFEQSTATCSFADVAFSECTGSAAIDSLDAVTFRLSCDIDAGDIVFQTCRDNLVGTGSRVTCTWEGGLENCTACPPGTFCEGMNTIDPPPCPHGHACDGASKSACLAGSYSTGGLAACLNCPNGSTCPLDGWGEPSKCPAKYYSGTGATVCEECWAGHACPTEATEWPMRCPNGYFALPLSDQCSSCAPGNSSYAGSSECYVCPDGTSCPSAATPNPNVCAAGYYSLAGATTCTPCGLGQYQPTAQSSSCLECPAGVRCPQQAISSVQNLGCPMGTYSRYDLKTTAFDLPYDETDAARFPSLAATGDTVCRQCPNGYTCPDPSTAPVPCPAGTTRIGTNYSHCINCPAGYSCATPNVPPAECADGYYSTGSQAECTACSPGFQCPMKDVALQMRCSSGTFSAAGAANCTACPAGRACPEQDGAGIYDCEAGTFALAGQVQCTPCPPGFECPDVTDPAAMAMCAKGKYSTGSKAACDACAKGFYNPLNGSTTANACIACGKGYYSNFTAAVSETTCLPCPADTYCPLTANDLPTECPVGLSTFGRLARTSADDCTMPPPPPPPPNPPPLPSSPPPPPLPPALAATIDVPPLTIKVDGTVAAFNSTLFKEGVAAAVGNGATAADVVITDLRSGSVVVDFHVATQALFPVALGGGWDVAEVERQIASIDAAIGGGTLSVGATVLSSAVESDCPAGTYVSKTLAGGSKVCALCPTGHYSGAINSASCDECAVGYAAGSRGMTACDICVAGTYASAKATPVCAKCLAGTYQPAAGTGSCFPCADFFFSGEDGATTCVACPANHLSGPSAWAFETPRMRSDGRLSDLVGGAVNRSGCIENATSWLFIPDPPVVFQRTLTMTDAYIVAATFIATFAFLYRVGAKHWKNQQLLLKYAGGDTFYETMLPEDEDADRRGTDPRMEKYDVLQISEAIKANNLEDAEMVIERILERDANQPETLHAQAVVHLIYGEMSEARVLVERAIKRNGRPQFVVTLGLINARSPWDTEEKRVDNLKRATQEFELATRKDPTLAVAHMNLGVVRMALNDLEGAKDALKVALDKEPEYHKALYNIALVFAKMGKRSDAKRYLKESINVKHRALDSQFNLGMLLLREGDVDEAERCFMKCLVINTRHSPSLCKMGNVQMLRGKPKRATEKYLLALESDPDNVEAVTNIGVVEWAKKHAVDAEQHFLLALKFKPNYYPALFNIGLLCMEQGRVQEAANWYRKAVVQKPTSAEALFQFGTALHKLGELRGETPRREEKSSAQVAIEVEEAKRVEDEIQAKKDAKIAEELGKMSKAETRARDLNFGGVERNWSRLVLVSSKVKGTEILERAPLDKTGVLVYNHKRSTLGSILKAVQKKLLTREGTQRVDSIAFVVPCKAGKVSICSGCSFTHDNMLDGDTCAFLDGLTHLINHDVNVYINGSRMDFLLLDDTIPESAELAMEIKAHCNLQTVTASNAMTREVSYYLTEEELKVAKSAVGARAMAMYFDLKKLRDWPKLPDEPLHHPLPPWETIDHFAEVKTEEEQKKDMKAVAIAAMAAEKLKGVGRSYAAYFRKRAAQGADLDEQQGDDTASEASPGPSSRGMSRAASMERDLARAMEDKDAALSSKAAQAFAGIATPASRVIGPAPGTKRAKSPSQTSSKAGMTLFRKSAMLVRSVARMDVKVREARAVTLELLIEMSGDEFRGGNTQEYFISEIATELDIHQDRVRIAGYDHKSSAVTVTVDDKPGDTPLDMVVSTLQMKLDSDTLLVDPSFGNIILTKVDWPEGWGEGKDKNSGVAGTDAKPQGSRSGWETPRSRRGSVAESEGGSEATEAGEAFRDLSAGAPRRLVLISSRMYFADVLMECVEAGVEAVYFDWRFSSLEKIAAECRDRCGGDLATLRSIGIMTHHKPGAIGLVKGLRTTRRNLVRPELRQFWASMAQLLTADGRVDVLSYDSANCAPTQRLLEELGDLIRVPVNTVDAAAVSLGASHGVEAAVLEDEDAFEAGSLYFSQRRFAAWAATAPDRFTVGAAKYRGRAAARLGGGSRADGSVPTDVTVKNAAGLTVAQAVGDETEAGGNPAYHDSDDDEVDADPARVAARRAHRLAELRRREETKRQLALIQNPANMLKAVTAPGAARTDGGIGSSAQKAPGKRPDVVPFIPVEKLVFARESASGYDARLDRYAADRARHREEDTRMGLTEQEAAARDAREDAAQRREALLDDLSLVPRLGLAAGRIGGGEHRTRALASIDDNQVDWIPPRNARDAARRAGGVHATDAGQGGPGGSQPPTLDREGDAAREEKEAAARAVRWREDGAENDAPAGADAVSHLAPGDPRAVQSKPMWALDENINKLRKFESTGLGNW